MNNLLHTGNPVFDEKLRENNKKFRANVQRYNKERQARNYNASVGRRYFLYEGVRIPVSDREESLGIADDIMNGSPDNPVHYSCPNNGVVSIHASDAYLAADAFGKAPGGCKSGEVCVKGGGHGSKEWCAKCNKVI